MPSRRTFLSTTAVTLPATLMGCLCRRDAPSSDAGESDDGASDDDSGRTRDDSGGDDSAGPPEDTTATTQFQYTAANAGTADGPAPADDTVQWQTRLSPTEGGLSVADGQVLVTAGDLVALDADDGSKRWEADVGHSHDAPPAVTSDTAYVAAWNGGPDTDRGVAAVDLEDGSLRWRAITDVDVSSAPTLADGVVYVGGSLNSEAVVALDATDGSERWRVRVGQYATTPAVADGTAYVGGGSEHAAYALEAATGEERWRVETDGRVWGAPTVVDDIVYVGSRGGTVYALEPADGETQWIASVGDDVHESIAATDERLYVPTADGLVALDTDGTEAWSLDGRSRVNAPSVVGDVVVVTDHSTAICLGEDGQRRWTYEFDERVIDDMVFGGTQTPPVVSDGVVYVASHGGDVTALGG
ncbi:PQQ-binding-like beta-propeller repeat protein [Natrialba swarupiae]|uniref:PQQ-binding-like beta-propeller repeat protein n=1 Tax=Natrialba swarupiae TaxID=2448032 RepID=A0A5D5ATC6_9EURY|nr:PQQ-binding-like beta-propeller repeat protein [Natrialba swarupiae]TYT62770.1 PQQ-binding-like beta-propeller repeat protein [Natrialba swarupiae]